MPRLIDDIRASGKLQKPWFVPPERETDWAAHTRRVAEILQDPGMPVLLIDNVADYYYRATDQEYWDFTRDFPNLAPPFERFWAEHKLPRMIHSKEHGDTDVGSVCPNGRVGMLLTSLTPDQVKGEGIPAGTRWILWAEIFVDYGMRGRLIEAGHGAMFLAIDGEGKLLDRPWSQTYTRPEHHEVIKSFITWLHPALLAVSFLHCKNVKIVDNVMDRPLAKKYRERTGMQPTPWKTLVIEPLKEILRTQGRSSEVGLARAMHICRGHFADYTEGRGLFGKYHGRFWIPATVRGTKRGEKPPAREIEVKV